MSEATAVLEAPVQASLIEGEAPPAPAEETPQEPPVYESGEAYAEAQGKEPPADKPPAAPGRTSPLADPRAAERIAQYAKLLPDLEAKLDTYVESWQDLNISTAALNRVREDTKTLLQYLHTAAPALAGYSGARAAQYDEHQSITTAMQATLPAAGVREFNEKIAELQKADGVAPYSAVFDLYADIKHKNWVSPTDHRTAIAKAFKDGEEQGRRNDATTDTTNGAAGRVRGAAGGNTPRYATVREMEAAFVANKITTADVRAWRQANPNAPY